MKFGKVDNINDVNFSLPSEPSANIEVLNDAIIKANSAYTILSHIEAKEKNIDPNFEFNDYSSVYHLVVDKKVITSFVMKDDKIVSFSYHMIKNKDRPRTPMLLK